MLLVEYFKVNQAALLYDSSRVRTFSKPPPMPSKATIKFDLPPSVSIVHLTPPDLDNHPLVSESYDCTLFNRVKDYFDRFYSSTDMSHVTLDSIDVILNPKLEEQFDNTESLFSSQFHGSQEMEVNYFCTILFLILFFSNMKAQSCKSFI